MNIFVINPSPYHAAIEQCDKHVVKMPLESAQMLCTAHRMLDGKRAKKLSKSGKREVTTWVHNDPELDDILYKSCHMSHPCTQWVLESKANYYWLCNHFFSLCDEYKHRYGKTHLSYTKLKNILVNAPKNIPDGELTPFKLAMKSNPECMFPDDPVKSYRLYYKTKRDKFKMIWSKRPVPKWFDNQEVMC